MKLNEHITNLKWNADVTEEKQNAFWFQGNILSGNYKDVDFSIKVKPSKRKFYFSNLEEQERYPLENLEEYDNIDSFFEEREIGLLDKNIDKLLSIKGYKGLSLDYDFHNEYILIINNSEFKLKKATFFKKSLEESLELIELLIANKINLKIECFDCRTLSDAHDLLHLFWESNPKIRVIKKMIIEEEVFCPQCFCDKIRFLSK
jgi:hypothetical protein